MVDSELDIVAELRADWFVRFGETGKTNSYFWAGKDICSVLMGY
jgi:hypothetical protein